MDTFPQLDDEIDEGEELIEEAPQEPQSPEFVNLAEGLDEDELKEIANQVIEDYEDDLESRQEWLDKHEEWLRLYYGTDYADNPPWAGASEESLPLLTEAVNSFQSRTYKAFFPNRYFVDCIPIGQSNPEARMRAERIGKHMSYQLGVLDRNYKRNKAQMFIACALHGSDFTKTYFSPTKHKVVTDRVRVQDLVVPYGVGPRNIEDLPRKTHKQYKSLNDTRILAQMGWYIDEGKPVSGMVAKNEDTIQDAEEEAEGLRNETIEGDKNDCLILEQHTLLDLDEDDIAEPYIVWVDYESRKVLRIQVRYEVDEYGAPIDDKDPIEHFTHYQFLPNPDGFYGLGMGHFVGDLNKAANKLTRMFIDANEMSVIGNLTYLISEAIGVGGDEMELAMGKGIKIPRPMDDIRKGFMQLDFKPPSQETLQMLQEIQDKANRIAANSDILSGQPDKVYQPQAMLAMIEQGLQLFSSVQEFLGYSMEEELQKIYRLNAKYLQQEEYFFDGDAQIQVTPEDYRDDFRVMPVFDPKYATRSQKLAKAQAEFEFAMQNPLMANNPKSLYLVSLGMLEALDAENIQEKVQMPPEPIRVDDQRMENAYFMMPPEKRPLFDVLPDQNHIQHIELIDRTLEWLDQSQPLNVPNPPEGDPEMSRIIQAMNNDQKEELIANLLRHRSLHMAFMYAQLNGVMDAQGNPIGQGGVGGMGGEPSDEEVLGALLSELPTA